MKTYKTGGYYDHLRRAFGSVEEMAWFLDRSTSYIQKRLTGGASFTEKETEDLNGAAGFYDRTDIHPVKFQKMQQNTKNHGLHLVYALVWSMCSVGLSLRYSVTMAREVAEGIGYHLPPINDILDQIYKETEV